MLREIVEYGEYPVIEDLYQLNIFSPIVTIIKSELESTEDC